MTEFTYTFIIPHHNSPELLNRCLDSIPQREDIQIIVVDDNSKPEKRPKISRTDVNVLYIDAEHTKGAGHARNVGLEKVKGKWLLFADCDDYYCEGFVAVLDKYANSDIDVLYFNYNVIGCDMKTISKSKLQTILQKQIRTKDEIEYIRYCNNPPWSKMISNEMVQKYSIRFEETVNGNDLLFSLFLALHSNKQRIIESKIYNYINTTNSLGTKKQTIREMLCRMEHRIKFNNFKIAIGYAEWTESLLYLMFAIIKNYGIFFSLKVNAILLYRILTGKCNTKEWSSMVYQNY